MTHRGSPPQSGSKSPNFHHSVEDKKRKQRETHSGAWNRRRRFLLSASCFSSFHDKPLAEVMYGPGGEEKSVEFDLCWGLES